MHVRVQWFHWLLAVILLLGLSLRLWGIDFGLPYTTAADETLYVTMALRMFLTGDPNPHWLLYPSLWLYLNALAYIPFFLVAKLAGVVAVPSDIPYPVVETLAVGLSRMPAQWLLARGLTAVFSAATIVAIYVAARNVIDNAKGALLAALLFAVSPTSVSNSQLIRPDTFAAFFVILSFIWSYRIVADPRERNYILAGIMAGLAASSKYNGGAALVPLLVAHLLRFGVAGWRRKEIYLGIVASVVAFVLTTPFAVLDMPSLSDNLRVSAAVYSTGSEGSPGSGLALYFQSLLQTEGLVTLFAAIQMIRLIVRRSQAGMALLAFPLGYFVFVGMLAVRNDRTILLVLPFLAILAALFAFDVTAWIAAHIRGISWSSYGAAAILVIVQVVPPLETVVRNDIRITTPDGRDAARVWIDANLPAGSRVALESYSPFVDPRRFVVEGVGAIPDHPLSWYEDNGFEYLIFSQGQYGRFYTDPIRFAKVLAKYNQFFLGLPEIKRFDDNDYEVRIFRTSALLPDHRVAARFGDYGDLIELVGYDVASKWMAGDPLRVKLYWRTLAGKSEPLEVSLRLLGQDDQEFGAVSGDLFQGKGWQTGVFETEWTIPANADAAPGKYHLDVGVVQARYSYRAPAKTWAGDNMERVSLSPFKMTLLPPSADELRASRTAGIRYGNEIVLLGYNMTDRALGGDTWRLTLYWQALTQPSRDYTVFVHLLNAEGKVIAQVDAQPRSGMYPTSIWSAGEVIRDDMAVKLPPDLASGFYQIEVGAYEYPGLTRLMAVDAAGNSLGDRWVLPNAIQVN